MVVKHFLVAVLLRYVFNGEILPASSVRYQYKTWSSSCKLEPAMKANWQFITEKAGIKLSCLYQALES
ncbi:hypothetical protein KSMBR1_0518 [Candidatus Kuenenia stuttgartiensis]|jgi:hypothetical protein|uniref:Uncharacterized protein n=1 Tax=Kuenenia stuttgartiensis TaxID=174633 RepID=A0A2C9CBE7_KUEST|nr:hypothetical protein KSMBR1_0518 [Candidatus Kuenenia stuttgartiensis]